MARVVWNSDIDVYNEKVMPVPVARAICLYLGVEDLLLFLLVSRNTARAARDPARWVSKLQAMSAWPAGGAGSEAMAWDLLPRVTALTCFDGIVAVPRLARPQVLQIRALLQRLYGELTEDVPYNRLHIFTEYHTPGEQAQLLTNLVRYNAIDTDPVGSTVARDKLSDLMEMFENALLRELEIHYDLQDYAKARDFVRILVDLKNDQTLIDLFLQKTCFDNDAVGFLGLDRFSIAEFYTKPGLEHSGSSESLLSLDSLAPGGPPLVINHTKIDEFVGELTAIFNELARVIDLIFPPLVPMMYKISEELITNQLQETVLALTLSAKEHGLFLDMVPLLYKKLTLQFVAGLKPSANVGESYTTLVRGLIDVSYEAYVLEYLNEEKIALRELSSGPVQQWKDSLTKREIEASESILKAVQVEHKTDFLLSFRKVFIGSGEHDASGETRAQILAENIKALDKVFSAEVALAVLQGTRASLERILHFQHFSISAVAAEVAATMQDEFMALVDLLGNDHLRVGFDKALTYLKEYEPAQESGRAIGPLVIFFELIHLADTIVQMLDIFYKEEMVHRNIIRNENSVLNPLLQAKRNLEGMVDKRVAEGLNIGIDVLFKQIDAVYDSTLTEADYNPPQQPLLVCSTAAAQKVVKILEENIDLLTDSAERSIVEVFQQEVAERFFQVIVKVLKRSTISVDGAVVLILDLNLYYEFVLLHIRSNKRMIYPLFQALKKVGTIFLIGGDDGKAIGQLVSDLSKFNGIFSQEEIYEFVQRRQDWPQIKKHVEKIMYGLSLGDCVVM